MRLLSTNALPQVVDAPAAPAYRDYTREQPASDEVFQIWRSLFTYDKTDLKARVEGTDDSTAWWRKERVSLAAAYGDERLTLYLLLPTRSKPPFQAIIYFPGSHVIHARSSQDESLYDCEKCVPEQGRALIYPVYKGTFERGDGLRTVYPAPTSFYRDHVIQWSKDLGRTIDYLETRKDIQSDRLAYLGLSWGAALGAILPALESRLKASVLVAGGFFMEPTLREVDQLNFAPHVSVPTLMINGRYDFFYPVESSQNHMFRLLGTAPENKVHIVLECGHSPPKPLFSKEMKDWFDRFLGPAQAP